MTKKKPQDAAWLLPSSSPLKCTSPADVYLLLKSSHFVAHDLSAHSVFEGCAVGGPSLHRKQEPDEEKPYRLELVLRKWFAIDPSREMRAFVRNGVLLGTFSQRSSSSFARRMSLCCVFARDRANRFFRPLAAQHELLRVSERARDAGEDRVLLRRILDHARQTKVDRSHIL